MGAGVPAIKVKAVWHALDLRENRQSAPLKVISVHDRVINLQPAGWPHLLMLAAPSLPRGPAVVGLSEPDFNACRRFSGEGASGSLEGGRICLPGAGNTIVVEWRESPPASFEPPENLPHNPAAVRGAVREYREDLARRGIPSDSAVLLEPRGEKNYFERAIAAAFPALVEALRLNKKKEFKSFCRKLVGLGRGSTPTGDDLVFGAVAAYHYYRRAAGAPWSGPVYPFGLAVQTTLLGRHMLETVRRGLVPEPVRQFLVSLFAGKPSPALLEEVCQIGAGTGYDIATAVLYTLEKLLD